jgi:hypothetical protein
VDLGKISFRKREQKWILLHFSKKWIWEKSLLEKENKSGFCSTFLKSGFLKVSG